MPLLEKGHRFEGPDGQGYELANDVEYGHLFRSSDFIAYGGAPTPEPGELMPYWLSVQTLWNLYPSRMQNSCDVRPSGPDGLIKRARP